MSLAFLHSYSYSSDIVYGSTGNAASQALNWAMANVLPQQAGLQVGSVIYRYTATKDPSADMLVHVQNQDALGSGYIFRETDDWSGLPGNTINKIVAINDIPIQRWGDGSIVVEGSGQVSDPSVIYTYKYDPCFNPQSNPSCPGYQPPIPEQEIADHNIYNALDDSAVLAATEETDPDLYDRDGKRKTNSEKREDAILQQGLAASENALNISSDVAQAFMIDAMANESRFNPYYRSAIAGGSYTDTLFMPGNDIPDNKKGLRNNLAQQILHERMVDLQYK